MTLTNGKYIITVEDIINNSEITEEDLANIYDEKVATNLANASKKIYNIYHNSYRGLNKQRQVTFMDWWVQQDTDRQNTLRDAIIEYIRGAVLSGKDLNVYEEKQDYTHYVQDILRDGGLWFPQTIQYEDSDIE